MSFLSTTKCDLVVFALCSKPLEIKHFRISQNPSHIASTPPPSTTLNEKLKLGPASRSQTAAHRPRRRTQSRLRPRARIRPVHPRPRSHRLRTMRCRPHSHQTRHRCFLRHRCYPPRPHGPQHRPRRRSPLPLLHLLRHRRLRLAHRRHPRLRRFRRQQRLNLNLADAPPPHHSKNKSHHARSPLWADGQYARRFSDLARASQSYMSSKTPTKPSAHSSRINPQVRSETSAPSASSHQEPRCSRRRRPPRHQQ